MNIKDVACHAKGFVVPSFVDIRTGERKEFSKRHNRLSYMSAEAMAAAFGGDSSYIPAKIGFIYGISPTIMEMKIERTQSWDLLRSELPRIDESVDVQVVGFSYFPSLGPANPEPAPSGSSGSSSESSSSSSSSSGELSYDSDGNDYDNILSTGSNAITFHAVSNSQDIGAAFAKAPFSNGNYVYQAVLLGYHNGKYYIISRVSLKENGAYLQKPSGFEIALDWTVAFY